MKVGGVSGVNCASHRLSTLCSSVLDTGKAILFRKNLSSNIGTTHSSMIAVRVPFENVPATTFRSVLGRGFGLGLTFTDELLLTTDINFGRCSSAAALAQLILVLEHFGGCVKYQRIWSSCRRNGCFFDPSKTISST